jgi:hypothetical protein
LDLSLSVLPSVPLTLLSAFMFQCHTVVTIMTPQLQSQLCPSTSAWAEVALAGNSGTEVLPLPPGAGQTGALRLALKPLLSSSTQAQDGGQGCQARL